MAVRCGTELVKLFQMMLIEAKPDCLCYVRARLMDAWGPRMCVREIETIVDWLEEEAEDRKLAGFDRVLTRRMVFMVIRRAIPVSQRTVWRKRLGRGWINTWADTATESLFSWLWRKFGRYIGISTSS